MAENPAISPATIEAMRRNFGLDRPWYVQYGLYLENILLHFDFGESFSRHQPVFTVIREGLGNTLMLAGAAAVVTWGLAMPLGIWAAVRQYSWVDKTLSLIAFVWLSVPEILSGLLLLMLAARTGWFPVGGMRSIDYDDLTAMGRARRPAVAPGASGVRGRPRAAGEPHAPDARQPAGRAAPRLRDHRALEGTGRRASSSTSTRCATR